MTGPGDTGGGSGREATTGAGGDVATRTADDAAAGACDETQAGSAGEWHAPASLRREYWSWIAGALYLLLSVDLLSTLYAAGLYGTAAEANPYVRWALGQDVAVLVALNLLALAVLAALFHGYLRLLARARGDEARVLARSFELWLGCLVAAGLFVFANNLAVIVHGRSLL